MRRNTMTRAARRTRTANVQAHRARMGQVAARVVLAAPVAVSELPVTVVAPSVEIPAGPTATVTTPDTHNTEVTAVGDAWVAACSCTWTTPKPVKTQGAAKGLATRHRKAKDAEASAGTVAVAA